MKNLKIAIKDIQEKGLLIENIKEIEGGINSNVYIIQI